MENLTQREKTILKYMAIGKTNIEIAEELFVSTHTIKAHVSSIMRKLGVSNRIKAAVYSVASGLIDGKNILKQVAKK